MIDLIGHMQIIRRRIRGHLVIRSTAFMLSISITWILASILIDALLRVPSLVRFALLCAGLFLLVRFVVRSLLPAVLFKPPLVEIALRVEKAIPSTRSRLATAVEFSSTDPDTTNPLVMKSIDDARSVMERSAFEFSSIIRTGPSLFAVTTAITAILVLICSFVFWNSFTTTGLLRTLFPLGSTMWPSTTTVVGLHGSESVHPRGTPFMLRSRLTRGDVEDTRITARIEPVDGSVSTRAVVLTPQTDGEFERMVDLEGDLVRIVFMTHDHESAPVLVRLVDPPSIRSTSLTVTPPEYASGAIESVQLDLGTGNDVRSSPDTPFLEGSTASFRFDMSKPLPVPDEVDDQWLETTFGPLGSGASFSVDGDSNSWILETELEERIGSVLTLVDEHGILNSDEIVFTIDVVEDRFPVTVMVEPDSDERILPGAVIPMRSESRDDILIESNHVVARRKPRDRMNAGLERIFSSDEQGKIVVVEDDLDMSTLQPVVGDVIEIFSVTRDVHREDSERAKVTSGIRNLKVIDETEFMSDIQSQVSSIRRSAIRLEELQSENRERTASGLDQVSSEQARITRRISGTDDAIYEIRKRLDRNNLDDPFMREVLDQSRDLLNMAARASSAAQGELERTDPSEPLSRDRISSINELQEEVGAELSDLITLLDRNQDDWVVSRRLSDLIESMRDVNRRTDDLGRDLVGRDPSGLNEEERETIDQLSSEQRSLADESEDLSRSLREKSDLMAESQSRRSESLLDAASRAQRSELTEKMERSSRRIDENQMERASELQNQILETLEEMVADLEEDPATKADELARVLADLVGSIEVLVESNEQRLIELSRVNDGPVDESESRVVTFFENTERFMRNTTDVGLGAGSDAPGGRRIARRILEAAADLESVMVRVRERPVRIVLIRDRMNDSLESLLEALELARSERDSAQRKADDRRREEIRSEYLDLSELQASIYLESSDLLENIEDTPTRRQTMRMRRLSVDQESIRRQLGDLLEKHPDLKNSLIVSGIHDMIDGWSLTVSETLADAVINDRVIDQESMIMDSMVNLASTLDQDSSPSKTFERNESQDSRGEGGSGGDSSDSQPESLIPPLAELQMLRSLQEQIRTMTVKARNGRNIDSGSIKDIAVMQRRLHDLGKRLMEQLTDQDSTARGGGA
ncbi:MAG: hypothetical protein CMJ40_02855 [Phycisphaerae bacterium]|nr:hypothetical protein [Phycisphaerae bacterium]